MDLAILALATLQLIVACVMAEWRVGPRDGD